MSQLAVAPGGSFAVVGGVRGDLLTLDLRSLDTVRAQAKAHVGEVRGVALSRDGSLLATGGDDRRVVVRDPRTLQERFSFPPLDGTVYRLAFSPDGGRLAIAGIGQRLAAIDRKASIRGLSRPGDAGSSARIVRPGGRPARGQYAGCQRPDRADRYVRSQCAARHVYRGRTA